MIIMLSMVGPALLIPLYVQNALGLSALLSGLVIMPGDYQWYYVCVYRKVLR